MSPAEPATGAIIPSTLARLAIQQAIAASPAVRIGIRVDGWYRVPQAQLVAAGLTAGVSPGSLQLFADGVEQPLKVTSRTDRFESGDAIEF